MSYRFGIPSRAFGLVLVALLLPSTFVAAQEHSSVAAKSDTKTAKTDTNAAESKKPWVMPRTPDGQPDLQGYWTSLSFTPMERPAKYGNREFLTPEEEDAIYKAGVERSFEFTLGESAEEPGYDGNTFALGAWQNGIKPNNRTSLIVDPPDGRIPPLTRDLRANKSQSPGAIQGGTGQDINQHPYIENNEHGQGRVLADVPTDLGVRTTCISMSGGPPILPGDYNSNEFIVQSPGYVVFENDYGSEVRIVPLDGRPHAGADIRQWHGDGRGHWEGDTLVVETTNFRPEFTFRNANPKTLKITERFKRTGPDTIEYSFTVDDPSTWTKPWTAIVPLSAVHGPLFEYDCSEDDYDVVNIMSGARMTEKAKGAAVPISQK